MPHSPPRLEDQLCFALYSATRAMVAAYRPILEAMDLTYPQYLVMMALWEDDGLRIGPLGDRLGMDIGTLSPLLKRMELRGFVSRHRSTEDERVVTVHLTSAGKELGKKAAKIPRQAFCKVTQSEEELTGLRDSIKTLARSLA